MIRLPRLATLLVALLPLISLQGFAQDTPGKIRVLVVDGQNNHDFATTTEVVKATLDQAGIFDVAVSRSPGKKASREAWDAWRPAFADYQVVVSNYNGSPWPDPVKKAFLAFVSGGGGVVSIHAANNSFTGWKEYEQMIGLCWRGAKYGERICVDDASGACVTVARGKGPGSGHGRQHAYVVKVREPRHPIMAGLPASWKHAKDELYHGQRGPAKDMTVLSSAWSNPQGGGTGDHEPITWTIPYGKGRVVTTVMGHHWRGQKDRDALHCIGFQTIVARSTEWAATGKVRLAVPKGFPTEDRTSMAPPAKVDWRAER